MRARVLDEVGYAVDAQRLGAVGVHDHDVRHTGHQRDRCKVLLWVERHLAVQRLVDAVRAHRAHQQRVAVGRRLGHDIGAHVAPRPGAVLHHEGLAESLAQLGRNRARQNVGGAAGRKWHDDFDRLGRPGCLRKNIFCRRKKCHRQKRHRRCTPNRKDVITHDNKLPEALKIL